MAGASESSQRCRSIIVEDRAGDVVATLPDVSGTASDLQKCLEELIGVPPENQTLWHNRVVLQPGTPLRGLASQDHLHVTLGVLLSPHGYPVRYLDRVTDDGITFYESATPSELGPGVQLWGCGSALAKFFKWREEDPEARGSCRKQHVLELGSGTGVVGLTLARIGALVTHTDVEQHVLDLLKLNVTANGLAANASVHRLSFGDTTTYMRQDYSLIVAADVLYRDGNEQLLSDTLSAYVKAGSDIEVYLGYLNRSDDQLSFFTTVLGSGFCVARFEDSLGNALGAVKGGTLGVYDVGSFVPVSAENVCGAILGACFNVENAHGIQIFRITRPAEQVSTDG
mmetsp:Transcript_14201/g.49921  ORF Transcript_14201/g.49921 Transcript_14201/m.49921 type:complete len:341 (-) Transcript_14201:43-1065(-)